MADENLATAVFAGGCFWCLEAVFARLRGVKKVEPGYTGGCPPNPTYEQVCTGATGHAEAVRITYAPGEVSYRDLLEVFFAAHDPTTLNRQGADVGTQYRSAIFYSDEEQKAEAERYIRELGAGGGFTAPIVTELAPLGEFYPAEEYHREYFESHPEQAYCRAVIAPKVAKINKEFVEKIDR